ncbi:hypothetical protein XYCOK13_14160 [Xylanibacillus composti]|uniref:NodB homology domain-containing protein n=1 Tax=Xylanibacillus composti TaxID=1572762 RepID=A0A8J4H347_9BACL|nr:polysaccharide deacetylase family protein [Xylanibacillus composti]GIQ68592.1 hypothetical protein XYCOK13_14160 [Xylanibacillus composti]
MGHSKGWVVVLCFVMVAGVLTWSGPIDAYIQSVKQQEPESRYAYYQDRSRNAEGLYMSGKANDADRLLMEKIMQQAEQYNEPAVDAKLDPVWKAIPGYNGREVDVEQTYKRSKTNGGEIEWVFRETEPAIQLEDIGPHPVYKGNPRKKMAAFMINVAWGNEYVPDMLDTLREHNVTATFFLDGSWLEKNEALAKQILEAGHELSNHAYSHPNMSQLNRQQAREQIQKTEQLLARMGVTNKLFAPPSGDYNQQTVDIAAEFGLTTVLWTLDTVDWKKPTPEWIIRRISPRLEPGAMILMHPTSSSSQALDQLIKEVHSKDLSLGTVSDLLSSKRLPR